MDKSKVIPYIKECCKYIVQGIKDSLWVIAVLAFVMIPYTINTLVKEQRTSREFTEKLLEGILIGLNLEAHSRTQSVTLTAYAKYTNSNELTAIGKKPIAGQTIAISDDLIMKGWLGRKIYIRGFGVFKATDVMGGYNKQWIDIYMPNRKQAERFGIKLDVTACVLD